jgi:quinoprotein relay system zinc metallohydrolase 1
MKLKTAFILLFGSWTASAANDYALKPLVIADGVQIFVGRNEHFTRDNGGAIANTGFIVGSDGVIVIDTGSSRLYGEQQRAAIARVTPKPVRQVYITHQHPDHYLGDQAYADVPIAALPATIAAIQNSGDALADNLYRLVGGWMAGTQSQVPTQTVTSGAVTVAGRQLKLIAGSGHTDGDLMIYDVATKTLFTGDLVFFERTPTTPNANVAHWLGTLDEIEHLDFKTLVPGHGPVVHDASAIAQTRDYLRWLTASFKSAAGRGLDMAEVMNQPISPRFQQLAVLSEEYRRSVSHLYPDIELQSLPKR